MTPPTTAPGPQPQPPRQASALLEVAIAAAPMLAAATRAVKSFRIVSTSIHDGFCRPTQDQGTLHIDWSIPTERLFPRMWISSGKTAGKAGTGVRHGNVPLKSNFNQRTQDRISVSIVELESGATMTEELRVIIFIALGLSGVVGVWLSALWVAGG